MRPEDLIRWLQELEGSHKPSRYVVAYSGGLDSTVLLHALCRATGRRGVPIVAVHVNHALHADAARWEDHCRRVAEGLGIEFIRRRIDIPPADPRGPEAAARARRYAAIAELVQPGDHVLTAHHQDDQAETLLLNLMRGSGAAGLAGIGPVQPLGKGLLLRPLLNVPREAIEAYAAAHALEWCEDPSNADSRFDRNYLRREILPVFRRRWPAVSARLARSAGLLAEANGLQTELAEVDLATLGGDPARLDLEALRQLAAARQRNVLRHAIRRLGLPGAPSARLEQAVRELLSAAPDAQPLVRWPGGELRRYRGSLYVLPPFAYRAPTDPLALPADGRPIRLGDSLGALQLERGVSGGIDPELVGEGLRVAFRSGGEALRPAGRRHTHRLKKLLQEQGVLPWMREFLPLLYKDEKLVAVGDLWLAQEAVCDDGYVVRWLERPPLF
ncbi:MAG TPA: tRNA lysidine(34) synthetase TilS [Woeseiaceae bacterium]|nr:tRNA lysidine(34) synthetase TilS [Woeseiaceae bacterium]